MTLLEALRTALSALSANLLRSILTMLGIIIGVAAVITMVAIGSGARAQVVDQIRSLGSNLIVALPGTITQSGVRLSTGSRSTLTEEDAISLERDLPALMGVAPVVRGSAQIVAGGANWNTSVVGITPGFLTVRDWPIDQGRDFTNEDMATAAKVALLGETVARSLFGDQDAIGQAIRIRQTPFTVIGVLSRKGQTPQGQDQDDAVLVPMTTAKYRVLGYSQANARSVGSILIRVHDGEDMSQAEADIRDLLRQRHRLRADQEDDFSLRNLAEIAQTRDASAKALSWLLAAVAGVSLLVGGIGIMNIMLVSVTERTREIGLRMAVGARPRDIRLQFLIESMMLSGIGGLLGVALGIGSGTLISRLAGWPTLVEPDTIALAVGVSAVIGVFFGFYPAQRAAQLDPIEALRAP